MKSVDSTNPQAHQNMRTLISQTHGGREHSLAERFRMHLVGVYAATVGPEWDSGGKSESDVLITSTRTSPGGGRWFAGAKPTN